MSNSILDITHNHGREMYILGLEHAVNVTKMLGEERGIAHLNEQIAKERKELDDERAQQIRRRAQDEV